MRDGPMQDGFRARNGAPKAHVLGRSQVDLRQLGTPDHGRPRYRQLLVMVVLKG